MANADADERHQEMASALRLVANQLDAGEVDCAMYMVVRKDRTAQFNIVDGNYFMAFESYLRNYVARYGRLTIEKALFPDA